MALRYLCRVFQSSFGNLRLCKSVRKFYAPLFWISAAIVSMLARKHFLSNLHSPRTPKSNANARAAQLLTQTGQIGAYILRSAFSVGCSKAHLAISDCANRCVNFTHRFSGHWRQLCGANCENSNKSESENVTAARVNFSKEYLALKTRKFVNDVDQRS